MRCQTLQSQLDQLTTTYAKQISNLKSQMIEQGAQLIITADSSGSNLNYNTPTIHKNSGSVKKKTAVTGQSMKLDPIEYQQYKVPQTQNQNYSYASYSNSRHY